MRNCRICFNEGLHDNSMAKIELMCRFCKVAIGRARREMINSGQRRRNTFVHTASI